MIFIVIAYCNLTVQINNYARFRQWLRSRLGSWITELGLYCSDHSVKLWTYLDGLSTKLLPPTFWHVTSEKTLKMRFLKSEHFLWNLKKTSNAYSRTLAAAAASTTADVNNRHAAVGRRNVGRKASYRNYRQIDDNKARDGRWCWLTSVRKLVPHLTRVTGSGRGDVLQRLPFP